MGVARTVKTLVKLVRWRELRVMIAYCPVCAGRRPVVRLRGDEMAVRCLACRSSAATMSMVSVLAAAVPAIGSLGVYELSSRGALFRYLRKNAGKVTYSEYFADVAPSEFRNGIQCQDVQRLSYPDASFDVCTSTEVFEHVPDDSKGFSEIFRVLRPKGVLVFTVPLSDDYATIDRVAVAPNGELRHLLPPEYHRDSSSESQPILVFRNYGRDIADRLRRAGFQSADIVLPQHKIPWGFARAVIVARRGS